MPLIFVIFFFRCCQKCCAQQKRQKFQFHKDLRNRKIQLRRHLQQPKHLRHQRAIFRTNRRFPTSFRTHSRRLRRPFERLRRGKCRQRRQVQNVVCRRRKWGR